MAIQCNKNSIGAKGVSTFFEEKLGLRISMSVVTYDTGYADFSQDEAFEYKSVSISFTKINELKTLEDEEDDNVDKIRDLVNNIGAIIGKLELSVGQSRNNFLEKKKIKKIIEYFKKPGKNVKSLKVKICDQDGIRLIDLINDKVTSVGVITVSKDDPKTFDKIVKVMLQEFSEALENELKYCKMLVEE